MLRTHLEYLRLAVKMCQKNTSPTMTKTCYHLYCSYQNCKASNIPTSFSL